MGGVVTALGFGLLLAVATSARAEGTPQIRPVPGFERETDLRERPAGSARPALKASFLSPTRQFRVHYTTVGDSAVPLADANGNGVPDWVEIAAGIADSVMAGYAKMGYDIGIGDRNVDGGPEFDLYFMKIPYYGLTFNGSDPYIELDHDFADRGFASHGIDALRVTLAHELFHAIQNRYQNGASSITGYWWREMTATFMEDYFYDYVDDFVQYLNPDLWSLPVLYERPDLGIDHYEYWSVYPYGGAVFLRFLWEKYGDGALAFIRATTGEPNYLAPTVVADLEATLHRPVEDLLAEFWIWSYFSGGRFRPGFFTEGSLYRPAPLESPYPDDKVVENTVRPTFVDSATVTRLGAHLLRLPPDGTHAMVTVRVIGVGSGADRWAWRLAVALPESVATVPPQPASVARVAGEITPAAASFVIPSALWSRATDAVLVASNGSISSASARYRYEISYEMPTAIAADAPLPTRTILELPSPNPFNAQVTIPFALQRAQPVRLDICDAAGRPVRTLLASSTLEAGRHVVVWDGRTDAGLIAGSGVYLLRFDADGATTIRRISLAR